MKKSKDSITSFLQSTFLFCDLTEKQITELMADVDFEMMVYPADELIYSPDDYTKKVGFVLSGECTVERRSGSEGGVIPLNKIAPGECFGILSVFSSEEEFPTYIRATKECEILFIDGASIVSLVNKDSRIAMNVIKLMGQKISFLNKKISTFSPNNTRQKVANHLYYLSKKMGDNFKLNCQKTSSALNIGRASLYRSIDSLVAEGIVEYTTGIIKILDIDKLERISK